MPVTRRRAAAAATAVQVVEEEGRDAAIDISSDSDAAIDISSNSDAGSESGSEDEEDSESEEEEDTSDEDFVDISDSEAGDGEGSVEESEGEAEAEAEQLGADRSEVACNKITGLLNSGKSLEGLKLAECKAYLKKNGLSQTGGIDTCVGRIVLHWRLKDGDPERIYPRSSFCVNCKGDVCRGDAVLFKQKVYEKSGKRHAKCIGKRIVAGKVIKESYGKQKQQHTFTIQVFWSKGAGKLPPLHLLLVKGRNLYRMMTFRQPWENEVERLKVLEEKHNRGDDARRVRALNRPNSGKTLKGKKKLDKEKHKCRSGRPHCQSNVTELDKGKKRPAQSSKFDMPNKRSKKEGSQVPSGKETTGGRRAMKNRAGQDKSMCTDHNSSICNDNREKNHATFQKKSHAVPLNKGPSRSKVRMNRRKAGSGRNRIGGGTHSQLEGRHITPATHVEANHGNFVLAQHPFVERLQRPTELHEVGHGLLTRPGGNHPDVLSNATMGLRHQNGAMAGVHAPAYFRGLAPNQQRLAFPSANMPQTVYHPHPEAHVVPHFRYPRGSTGFR